MKPVGIILLGLLGLLQVRFWLGEGSYTQVQTLKETVRNEQQRIKTLKERNQLLEAEVQDLKIQLGALEELARTDLGMLMQGETFLRDPSEDE